MAISAGAVYLDVLPNMSKFQQGVQGSMSKFVGLGKQLAGGLVAGFAAVKAISVIKDFVGGAIEAAEEAQKVNAQTEAVLKSTGNVAGVTAQHVLDLADSIKAKTAIDDEAIRSGQNLLLTFTKIRNEVGAGNNIFDQASETIVDMSAALGTDLRGSAIRLGKALNDPIKGITALSRAGVSFTEEQKELIKSLAEAGDTLSAQKLILKELNREFAGSAEAQATASDRMRQAWADLQQELGEQLLPILEAVNNFVVAYVIPSLKQMGAAVGAVARNWKVIVPLIGAAAVAFEIATGRIRLAIIALSTAHPILLAITVALAAFSFQAGQAAQDAAKLQTFTEEWTGSLISGDKTLDQFNARLAVLREQAWEAGDTLGWQTLQQLDAAEAAVLHDVALDRINVRLAEGTIQLDYYRKRAQDLGLTQEEISANFAATRDAVVSQSDALDEAIRVAKRYARQATKSFREIVESASSVKDVYSLTTQELIRQSRVQLRIARIHSRDTTKLLAMDDLPQRFRDHLMANGAEMHAYVTGDKGQQKQIRENWNETNKEYRASKDALEEVGIEHAKLDGKKADVHVQVHYSWTGVDPKSLPGFDRRHGDSTTGGSVR